MAPTGLEHLPTELLHMILGYLGVHYHIGSCSEASLAFLHNDTQTRHQPSLYTLECQILSTLCLVSRHLRHVIEPILYQQFMPGYGDLWYSSVYTWEGRLTSFMRTVAERRDLAALVKRIYIHPYLFEQPESFEINSVKSEVWARASERVRENINEREAQDTLQAVANALAIEGLQNLSVRDLISVLIVELPNLKHCNLQIGGSSIQEMFSARVFRTTGVSHLSLTTLKIAVPDLPSNRGILFFIDQHTHSLLEVCPYLETLNLYRCGGMWPHNMMIPSLSNLKTLYITQSKITANDLQDLISCCHSLQTFVYEAGPISQSKNSRRIDLPHPEDRVHFKAFHAARILRSHRKTLESIHLDLRWRKNFVDDDDDDDDDGDRPPPFSFRDFNMLQHLFLSFTALYDPAWENLSVDGEGILDFLPPSLVSLHFALGSGEDRINHSRTQKGLLCLARAASQGKFPNLKEVRCGKADTPKDGSILNTAFAAAGVDFNYDDWSFIGQKKPPPSPTLEGYFVTFETNIRMPLPPEEDSDF